jgi:hypothetical protein
MPPATPQDTPERVLQLVASGDITLPDLEVCWCCAGILGRAQRAAVYWWLTCRGFWLGLCVKCCAIWRMDAGSDPWLQSVRVTDRRPDRSEAA